jgi:hypothetical protein
MKVYTFGEIKDLITQQGYKYVALFDYGGRQIIPYNAHKMKAGDRLREIETRLLSAGLLDGYYLIKCKNAIQAKITDDYLLHKGEKLSENETPAPMIMEKPVFQPEVLTYDGALKLQIELERLKLENGSLKREIENLKNDLSEMESENLLSEESTPKTELLENAKTFLSEAMGFVAPLLDKHFDLKEKALAIRALEIENKRPIAQPKRETAKTVENWINGHKSQTEVFNSLVAIYNSATGPENFNEQLKEFDESLYNNYVEYAR